MTEVLDPDPGLPEALVSHRNTLRCHLQNRFMCAQEGWTQRTEKKQLDDIFIDLFVTYEGAVKVQHEVQLIETALRGPEPSEEVVQISEIFKHPSGKNMPVRIVLTNGIAGIGKTFLVNKLILDWSEGRAHQDVHLVFPFTFRQLNLLQGGKLCLSELIHECIRETKDLRKEDLNDIFRTLQASGNTNFNKSPLKLLFVLDGFDESRLKLDFTADTRSSVEVTQAVGVEVLLTRLIKGELLPSARLWITSRPAAANQIPRDFVDVWTEVRGFTDSQKEEYFRRRFQDEESCVRILSHIRASRSLHIMCHIPVFCWITSTILGDMLRSSSRPDLPKTLTELYTQFLMFHIGQTRKKYGPDKSTQSIRALAKLAFQQLEKRNIIFYEEDLRASGLHVDKAAVCSGVFTQIFQTEHRWRKNKDQDRMFSFVHLSIQEFLAAVHVVQSFINRNKNVMLPPLKLQSVQKIFSKPSMASVQRQAVDKALESPDGHLDLFLRFLLGLFMEGNQKSLQGLLKHKVRASEAGQETARYIKKKIRKNPGAESCINLFHCLNELQDHALVEEIQQYLSSGNLSRKSLTPAQWSALVFILLSSEEDTDVFDLGKYSPSNTGLQRLLPVFRNSSVFLLSSCNLSEKSCGDLASVLSSQRSILTQLDLNNNNLQDSGVQELSEGLRSPHCRLQTLRLSGCKLSWRSCEVLSSVVSALSSSLKELDLSNNWLEDKGVSVFSEGLKSSCCKLETLRLDLCDLTEHSCGDLASVLDSGSGLTELDLSNNDVQNSGLKLLSEGLRSPGCRLEILRLSGCLVSEEGCAVLVSALSSNPTHLKELDLRYNHIGASGEALLSARLTDPQWRLETLRVGHSGTNRMEPGLRKYWCDLSLDPDTVNPMLSLSEENRTVTLVGDHQPYPQNPERFQRWKQLLCTQGLMGRCYWELERKGFVAVGVAYRGLQRTGKNAECCLGLNDQSWSLCCSRNYYAAFHNGKMSVCLCTPNHQTDTLGVYLDWPAGVLSFYKLTPERRIHLHTFHCAFTQPLYPGFWFEYVVQLLHEEVKGFVRLRKP